jgi:hypothetical protein
MSEPEGPEIAKQEIYFVSLFHFLRFQKRQKRCRFFLILGSGPVAKNIYNYQLTSKQLNQQISAGQ